MTSVESSRGKLAAGRVVIAALRLQAEVALRPRTDVIACSSRNLGTYTFFKLPEPHETHRAFRFFNAKLGEIGFGKTNVYPVSPTR